MWSLTISGALQKINFFFYRNASNGSLFEYFVRDKDRNILSHSGFTASLLCEGLKVCDGLWINTGK